MGMDLYKYTVSQNFTLPRDKEQTTYLGENLSEADLKSLSQFKTETNNEYVDFYQTLLSVFPTLDINQEMNSDDSRFLWDFSLFGQGGFAITLNDESSKTHQSLLSTFHNALDTHINSDELFASLEIYTNKLNEHIFSHTITNEFFECEYGLAYIFSHDKLNTSVSYSIPYSERQEIDYMRKPFRHSQDNTFTSNFGGNDSDAVSSTLALFCGNPENSVVSITNKHPMSNVKKLASLMDNDNKKHFLKMFPLKDNEIIKIDW